MGRGQRSVHRDMHSRETEHGPNMNGDQEALPEPEERRAAKDVSAGDLFEGTIQNGHRGLRSNLRRLSQAGYLYSIVCTLST